MIFNNLISKKAIGIDIDDRSVKIVEVGKTANGKIKVLKYTHQELSFGIVQNGLIQDKTKLLEALKPLNDFSFNSVKTIFSLSERQVFFSFFETSLEDLNEIAQEEAIKNIPIPEDDLVFNFKILRQDKERKKILITGTSRKVLKEWNDFFQELNIEINGFDIETLAIFRSLFVRKENLPVCIFDFGALASVISVFDQDGLFYSHTIKTGSDSLTKAAMENLSVDYEEALEMKVNYGLSLADKSFFPVFAQALEPVVAGLKEALSFFGQNVSGVIVLGGGSKLRGIKEYLEANLENNIWIASPVQVKSELSVEIIEAMGVGVGALGEEFLQGDPIFVLSKNNEKHLERNNAGDDDEVKIKIKDSSNKLSNKNFKVIFLFILLLIMLAGAFWFRKVSQEKRNLELKNRIKQFQLSTSTSL